MSLTYPIKLCDRFWPAAEICKLAGVDPERPERCPETSHPTGKKPTFN